MTKFEKLLLLLSDGNWHSTAELVESVGHRFSATIHVAKQKGYWIDRRKVDRSCFEYRFNSSVASTNY